MEENEKIGTKSGTVAALIALDPERMEEAVITGNQTRRREAAKIGLKQGALLRDHGLFAPQRFSVVFLAGEGI